MPPIRRNLRKWKTKMNNAGNPVVEPRIDRTIHALPETKSADIQALLRLNNEEYRTLRRDIREKYLYADDANPYLGVKNNGTVGQNTVLEQVRHHPLFAGLEHELNAQLTPADDVVQVVRRPGPLVEAAWAGLAADESSDGQIHPGWPARNLPNEDTGFQRERMLATLEYVINNCKDKSVKTYKRRIATKSNKVNADIQNNMASGDMTSTEAAAIIRRTEALSLNPLNTTEASKRRRREGDDYNNIQPVEVNAVQHLQHIFQKGIVIHCQIHDPAVFKAAAGATHANGLQLTDIQWTDPFAARFTVNAANLVDFVQCFARKLELGERARHIIGFTDAAAENIITGVTTPYPAGWSPNVIWINNDDSFRAWLLQTHDAAQPYKIRYAAIILRRTPAGSDTPPHPRNRYVEDRFSS